jgi:cell wall-associated NlpC family hydrolase
MPDGHVHDRPAYQTFRLREVGCAVVLVTALLMAGCAGSMDPAISPDNRVPQSHRSEQLLRAEIRSWLGTPHRMGGMSQRGVDCSGLVVILYANLFDIHLPRTTLAQMGTGRQVGRDSLVAGDLVFFKPAKKYYHVGIYLGHGEFVHTSTSNGVMVSQIDDGFWRECYLTGRRVL